MSLLLLFGGGQLPAAANPLLTSPALRLLIDCYLSTSLPLTLPADLTGAPVHWSTVDTYPGGALGTVLYEGRVTGLPDLTFSGADTITDVLGIDAATLSLSNADGALNVLFDQEVRGKRVHLHLWDANTGTLDADVLVGQIAAVTFQPRTVVLTVTALDPGRLGAPCPPHRITTDLAPYAPATPGPSGGLGEVVTVGQGIGTRLPCRWVRTRDDVGTQLALDVATVDASANTLEIAAHGLGTGAGPFTLATTGVLPGGLAAGVSYWVIFLDEDTLRLAESPATALLGTFVDLTSAGSGTLTLRAGRAPQPADEYDYLVGLGNLGIDRLVAGGDRTPYVRDEWTLLPRTYRIGGRCATAVRFQRPQLADGAILSLLADVQGVYPDVDDAVVAEWKWLGGFHEDVRGDHAITGTSRSGHTSDLDTGSLVTGATGVGLGALRFDGVNDYLDVPVSEAYRLQTFTLEAWLYPDGGTGNPVVGPFRGDTGTAGGWKLRYQAANDMVDFQWTTAPGNATSYGSIPTMGGTAPRRRWVHVVVVKDATAATVRMYIDGIAKHLQTSAAAVYYDTKARGMAFGLEPFTADGWYGGLLGYVRLSSVARDAAYIRDAHDRMRRCPARFAREVLTLAGEAVDRASFDTAGDTLAAVEDRALKADGYVTRETTAAAVLDALRVFRGLRPRRGASGVLTATVLAPVAEVAASFSTGEPWLNVVGVESRRRASLADAIREQPMLYRPARDSGGTLLGYQHRTVAQGPDMGRVGDPLELPLVYDHVTADVIRSDVAQRLVVEDEQLVLTVQHEGRRLRDDDIIRVTAPPVGIDTARDWRVTAARNQVVTTGLVCVPYDASVFAYAPGLVPIDPVVTTRVVLDLGTSPGLILTNPTGRTIHVDVELRSVEVCRPIADGPIQQASVVVGAAAHWAAVAETAADGDTSYVALQPGAVLELVAPRVPTGGAHGNTARVKQARVVGRTKMSATPTEAIHCRYVLRDLGGLFARGTEFVPSTSYADTAETWATDPFTGLAWTRDALGRLTVGIEAIGLETSASVRVTQLALEVTHLHDVPPDLGFWRLYCVGPSASQPATPAPSAAPLAVPTGLVGYEHTVNDAGTYWYWARLFDRLGRLAATLGPTSIAVT